MSYVFIVTKWWSLCDGDSSKFSTSDYVFL